MSASSRTVLPAASDPNGSSDWHLDLDRIRRLAAEDDTIPTIGAAQADSIVALMECPAETQE